LRARLACLAAALVAGPAIAAEDAPEQAAAAVLEALRLGDSAALKGLAAKDDPDPWLVADELCARGSFDAATAFARASPRKDTERLQGYVAAQREKETDPALRKLVQPVNDALDRGDVAGALALVGEAKVAGNVSGARLLYGKGIAHRMANRWIAASGAFSDAARCAAEIGWVARHARALYEAGGCAFRGGMAAEALAAWEQELRIHELRGNRPGIAEALGNLGAVHGRAGQTERALELLERSLNLVDELGDREGTARALGNLGAIRKKRGEYAMALEHLERALEVELQLGDQAAIASTLGELGVTHASLRDWPRALERLEQALKLQLKAGDRMGAAESLLRVGSVHDQCGDHALALEYTERAMRITEELGDRGGVARALANASAIHAGLQDYPRALQCGEQALALLEALRDREAIAAALKAIGAAHEGLGEYARALACQDRALNLLLDLGDRRGAAGALGNIGNIYRHLGDYPSALDCQERSLGISDQLGDRAQTAAALVNLGIVQSDIGDDARALASQERALRLMEEVGDRGGAAAALGNIGAIHRRRGEYPRALECGERTLKSMRETGDRQGTAAALAIIGSSHAMLRDYPLALQYQENALRLEEELGDREGAALTLLTIGAIHANLGDHDRALQYMERTLGMARQIGAAAAEVSSLGGIATAHLEAGRPAEAVAFAREAVERLPALVRRLGEEQGAAAREQFANVFAVGARAGACVDDPSVVAFFLESGRAGSLLETLGGRDSLRATAVPGELRTAESVARAAQSRATALLGRAVAAGDRAAIATARAELDRSRDQLLDVIARIQRDAKRAADVLYPKARALEEIRGGLREGEALVLYGLFRRDPLALVVTSREARIVALGDPARIASAAESLAAIDAGGTAELADLVVRPLALDAKTTRVLVSPDGTLAGVPFTLLFPGREVVYVPSGTTCLLLSEGRAPKGSGVLALGDPDYGRKPDPKALLVLRGEQLVPLPGSREEAKAVGDVVLLGADATESRLRAALAARPRWRAVHLACHGLVDAERPLASSLALTPGDEEDGFLQTLEVFRLHVPADLVVLSACETAKGKAFRAEGVVGFTRAFMFAGAPRVMVSLWKVDDAATRALMSRFYELWKTMPAAAALLESQRFVASHEKWKHPRFWAAWQLWGLGD
jgi:CHAT domain-containing protein/Tfp pilus assembly protein PilF